MKRFRLQVHQPRKLLATLTNSTNNSCSLSAGEKDQVVVTSGFFFLVHILKCTHFASFTFKLLTHLHELLEQMRLTPTLVDLSQGADAPWTGQAPHASWS